MSHPCLHYEVVDAPRLLVGEFVVLAEASNATGYELSCELNILEMLTAVMVQSLSPEDLDLYLPKGIERNGIRGLNVALPLSQPFKMSDSNMSFKDKLCSTNKTRGPGQKKHPRAMLTSALLWILSFVATSGPCTKNPDKENTQAPESYGAGGREENPVSEFRRARATVLQSWPPFNHDLQEDCSSESTCDCPCEDSLGRRPGSRTFCQKCS